MCNYSNYPTCKIKGRETTIPFAIMKKTQNGTQHRWRMKYKLVSAFLLVATLNKAGTKIDLIKSY